MKRSSALIILFVAITTLVFSACKPAAPDTNRNAVAVATPTPIDKAAIETEIQRLENAWASAAMKHDAAAVRDIMSDDIVLTYADGSTGTKATELEVIGSGAISVESWEILEPKVTVLDGDTAFITGRSIMRNAKIKDAVSKRTEDISGQYRFTDVYEKRNGKWQAVASHTTKIENPPAQ